MKANARHSAVVLLIVLSALAILLGLFPDIRNSSLIVAVGVVSGVIEIIGFLRDRSSRQAGPQTNIAGGVQGPVFSGQIDGPVAAGAGGEAADFRDSIGMIYKPSIIQREKLPVPRAPSPPQDFTGRGKELEEILKSFDRGATITGLRGTGGIGKTALALVMADRLKSRFPDGQIFLKLEGTSPNPLKPAEAMAQVIRAFRGSEERLPEDQNELQGLYNSVLEGKRILLLLDNAVDDKQVIPLLPPKGCAALVTSRQNFTLPGMPQPFSLDTMKPEEARDLLLKISPRIGDQAGELARLCGHLPLALRAAASFLAVKIDLKPSAYLEELRSERTRLEKIVREGVDLDVEACFDLSYSRLPAETARVFGMLSVFPSDFDAAAEEVICQDEGHQHLSELLRWSLVEFPRPEGEGRYHLHDLVRLFAFSLQDRDKDLNLRHATYYQELLQKANHLLLQGGDSTHKGLQLFDLEWTNIQNGQNWTATNADQDIEAARICSDFAWAGSILNLRLHPQENVRWLQAALSSARRIKSKDAEGAHLGNLGLAYSNLDELRKAIEYYEQALAIAREIGDRRSEGADLGNLGIAYKNLGEPRKAIEFYEQALAIAREIGDRRGEGNHLGNLGNAYYMLGESGKAQNYYQQQLEITREIGNRRGEANALWGMAICNQKINDLEKAVANAEEALKIFEQIESPSASTMRELISKWQNEEET
jgi:tetratricopeptide (TPR) repeat protein